jgi:endo-1,4-beta-xylanase
VTSRALRDDSAFAALITRDAAVVVPETELKWNYVHPTPARFDFTRVDDIVRFADARGMRVRGHTLVWHWAMPPWVQSTATPANADSILGDYVATVVGRYAGQITSWDVVNEAVLPEDGREDGLRNSLWLRLLGPGYIATAFRVAHEADPSAQLIYNDYGLEEDSPWSEARRRAVLRLLRDLRMQRVPVHALGIQGHLSPDRPMSAPVLTAFLDSIQEIGLRVVITELDVRDHLLPSDTTVRDSVIASTLSRFLGPVLQHPATEGVLTWGLSDRYTWLRTRSPRSDGLPPRPLPYDEDLQPKRARRALVDALQRRSAVWRDPASAEPSRSRGHAGPT